jgi:Cu+-exporting ATPase
MNSQQGAQRSTMQKTTTTDPVCGMQVNPDTADASYQHNGQTYYFCSAECKDKFKADPAKYAKEVATA